MELINKYTIYIYSDTDYGTTGISFKSKNTAIKRCDELKKLNGMSYGIFLEYIDENVHHRRLVWKDGVDINNTYIKKPSYTANVVFVFIKNYFSRFKKVPTFIEIRDEVQKRDYDIIRILKSLDDLEYIAIDKPISKNSVIKSIKK